MSTTRPVHVAERPRVWLGVFLLATAAIGLLIIRTSGPLVYAPLSGAAVTLCGFLAAKANQAFFGERTEHVATRQRLWAGVLLGITAVVAAFEVVDGESVLYGAFLGLFVALPITTACLLAAKVNQVMVSPGRRNV
ncbi:hypothetical protein [Halalkalicoccus jeotgali]|uniref:Uncharacterized protein n=1 Tax=Halalkalicoccus jeotgali (strain DSM 18796 / CECT 7217 / JCM 14584 / KCTC 4019 / B3) TaxID=795797 RepID=D8J7Q1_HALJB|nr:hypothetical protein [Halalkalicoccus jeotgali]ADJ16071.1 hypothetical protein HacjB3_13450 [Halalkalicoccus jeotgali B3]ELY38167.1 hypothetical protein C497_08654 [Halalkalicoccus jeotgali B3]